MVKFTSKLARIVVLLLVFVITIGGLFEIKKNISILKNPLQTYGEIVNLKRVSWHSTWRDQITVKYNDSISNQYIIKETIRADFNRKIGDNIRITYSKNHPSMATVFNPYNNLFVGVLLTILGGLGTYGLYRDFFIKKNNKSKKTSKKF